MDEFSKEQKRRLRELASLAYERELTGAVEDLEAEFAEWREGEINVFDLSERIHEFHQGPARDLFGAYRDLKDPMLVARGLAFGLLRPEEVDGSLRTALEDQVSFFESRKR